MPLDFTKLPTKGEKLVATRYYDDEGKPPKKVTYEIMDTIGSGAFGAVYKGRCEDDGTEVAIKCEPIGCKRKMLQREFATMRAGRCSGSPYFTDYGERARVEGRYFFFTMQLVGRNLWDLMVEREGNGFSLNTACKVAIQTLAAIRDLHEVHHIHRDIKSANFAVGRKEGDRDSIIYMLDFGMCRKFRLAANQPHLRERSYARYQGTARYASRRSLESRDQSRKDDMESWFYMVMEFTCGNVPWNKMKGREDVLRSKNEFRHHDQFNDFLKDCTAKTDLRRIMDYVDEMGWTAIPDYDGLRRVFLKIIERFDYREHEALDWSPRREYQPPDWSRAKYIKKKDRFGQESVKARKGHTVTDSSDRDRRTSADTATATATAAAGREEDEKEKEGEDRGQRKMKKTEEKKERKETPTERVAMMKESQKRTVGKQQSSSAPSTTPASKSGGKPASIKKGGK